GQRLDAGRVRLQLTALALRALLVAGEAAVQALDQLLLREVQRVRGRQGRQQAPLVRAEVQQQCLLVGVRRAELAALVGVADGDRQCGLGRADRCAADRDPALDERAEHREEAPV